MLPLLLGLPGCGDPAPSTPADGGAADARDVPEEPRTYAGPAAVVVTRYGLALDVATRQARATLALRVRAAGDCVELASRVEDVTEVTLDGAPARDVTHGEGRLRACDPASRGYAVDREVSLGVAYTVPQGTWRGTQIGFSTRNDAAGRPFTYALGWVEQCDRLVPCDPSPGTFATYDLDLTHAMDQRAWCAGQVTAEPGRTRCTFRHEGGPTYSTLGALVGRSWTARTLGTREGVTVVLHDNPAVDVARQLNTDAVLGFLAWMSRTFGPYPYGDELRIVVAPTFWAGFEHPGNIALGEGTVRGRLDHTVLHEIAHQWAGDQTTLASARDFVWKEAMAEYLAYVWEDENLPAQAQATRQVWKDVAFNARTYPVPEERLTLLEYYGSAYGPGPMIFFRQLESLSERPRVLAALRELLGRPRALSVEDVQRALERATGLPLEGYFRAWLRGPGAPSWPTARIARSATPEGATRVTVTLSNRDGRTRGCRFRVRLRGAGMEMYDIPMDFGTDGATERSATAMVPFEVTREELDPLQECLVYPASEGASRLAKPVSQPWLADGWSGP